MAGCDCLTKYAKTTLDFFFQEVIMLNFLCFKHFGLNVIEINETQYAIGYDSDCYDAARSYLESLLWKQDPKFLSNFSALSHNAIETLQKHLGEECNADLQTTLLEPYLYLDECLCDGFYHFLSPTSEGYTLRDFIDTYPNLLSSDELVELEEKYSYDYNYIHLFKLS